MTAQRKLGCYLGRHRWATDFSVVQCQWCGKERSIGKTIRCRIGMHRWSLPFKDGDAVYRWCPRCGTQHEYGVERGSS
jgi:hypothetical protein